MQAVRAEVVRACLASEGASRYDADPWGEFSAGDVQVVCSRATRVRPEGKSLVAVDGVVRKAALADSLWTELKVLSRRMAMAKSKAERL